MNGSPPYLHTTSRKPEPGLFQLNVSISLARLPSSRHSKHVTVVPGKKFSCSFSDNAGCYWTALDDTVRFDIN